MLMRTSEHLRLMAEKHIRENELTVMVEAKTRRIGELRKAYDSICRLKLASDRRASEAEGSLQSVAWELNDAEKVIADLRIRLEKLEPARDPISKRFISKVSGGAK